MNWRERLKTKGTNWQTEGERLFLPVEDALTILHEARRAAFLEAENACEGIYSMFGCREDGPSAGASGCVLKIRALAAKEGET